MCILHYVLIAGLCLIAHRLYSSKVHVLQYLCSWNELRSSLVPKHVMLWLNWHKLYEKSSVLKTEEMIVIMNLNAGPRLNYREFTALTLSLLLVTILLYATNYGSEKLFQFWNDIIAFHLHISGFFLAK